MNVYIACSLRERARAREFRKLLVAAGYTCTSTWIDRDNGGRTESDIPVEECLEIAQDNQRDMDASSALIALTSDGVRGLLVEIGYMVGSHARVVVVCKYPKPSLMVGLRGVVLVEDERFAIEALRDD